jgi:anaerobic selenocysteine-containing dehydrogenase
MCGIAVDYRGDEILAIRGDKDHVLSKGNICPKASGLQDVHTDPDRLRKPVKKIDGEWHEIGWGEAFDEVATRLADIQRRHGVDAIASYTGRSIAHNIGALLSVMPTRLLMQTKNVYTASTVDQQPHNFAWYFMFGHQLMATIPNLDRTDYYLMLGTNPKISNGAQMASGANVYKKLDAIRARGGKVVLIDPRRTETAEHCSEHHFIRPTTDALFLMGVVKVIFEKGLATPGRLGEHIVGWDEVEPIACQFDLEQIANATGITAEDIERIAVELAAAKSAICYGRTGLSMQEFGGLCNWLMMVINIITGNMDEPGGMTFPLPAVDALGMAEGAEGSWDLYRSRVSGRPEFAGELPVSVLAEEIMTPGEGQIRGLLSIAGNGALSLPNGKLFEEALDQLEFMVAIDLYINETTRHADIILPAVGPFEKGHYDLFYHTYNTINWTAYNPPLFEPDAPGYTDWDIMCEVLERLVIKRTQNPFKKLLAKIVGGIVRRWVTPELILDLGLRFGPYGAGLNPFSKEGLSLKKLRQNPHGIHLGEHKRCLPDRLFHEDKKIHLAPEVIVADVPRLKERWLSGKHEAASEFDMVIVGRLQRRTLGWMHNSHRLVKGKDSCTLYIHPDDANTRGIEDGSVVSVSSAAGSIQLPAEITDTVMQGVVCMPPLWGHDRPGTRRAVATAHPGASMNDITNQKVMDQLTGNAVVHGVPVKVEPAQQPHGLN